MRKIFTTTSALILAGLGFMANAGELGQAKTVGDLQDNGYASSYVYSMALSWGENLQLEFTNDPEAYFIFTIPGKDPQELTTMSIEGSELNLYFYDYPSALGEYIVELPAGIIADKENGDVNPAQTLTFTMLDYNQFLSASSYNEYFHIEPPISDSYSNDMAYYTADELSNVVFGWTGYDMEPTNIGKVVAYTEENYQNQIDITDYVTVENGVINLDLSSLGSGFWYVNVPRGFAKTTKNGTLYVNSPAQLPYLITGEATPLEAELIDPTVTLLSSLSSLTYTFGQPISLVENAPEITCTGGSGTYTLTPKVSTDYYGNYTLIVSIDPSIVLSGEYTITIPAGVVTNGVYQNELIEEHFTIYAQLTDYIAVPADHSKVGTDSLKKITVTFPDAVEIKPIDYNWTDFTLTVINYGVSREEMPFGLDNGVSFNGNEIIITLEDVVGEIKELDYEIKIPAFDFLIDGEYTNPQIYLYYTAWNGMADPIILMQPAEKSNPAVEVELTWDYQNVTPTDDFAVTLTYGYYGDDSLEVPADCIQLIHVENPEGDASQGENALYIDLKNVIGDYIAENPSAVSFTLTVPAGIVENQEGQVNPESKFTFTVYPVFDYAYNWIESEDTPGVYYLFWDDVTWMSTTTGEPILVYGNETVAMESDWNNPPAQGMFYKGYIELYEYEGQGLAFNLNGCVDEMERTELIIPEGFIYANFNETGWTDYMNPMITIVLSEGTTTGMESIANPDATLRVFNLQGINVLNTINSGDLKNLPKGIYIVNGKKVFIGK